MPATIPNTAGKLTVTYRPAYTAWCRVGNAPFHGSIIIVYEPATVLLEFEAFEVWLRTLTLTPLTIEELARGIFTELRGLLGDTPLSVTVHAETIVHAPVSATIKE